MTSGLLGAVVEQARRRRLLSEQHFCVDGTLIDVLTDNRHALVVDAETTHASGSAVVGAALAMQDRRPGRRRLAVGADKHYDQ